MPETHLYPLTVAGVGITLKTAVSLPVSDRFQPFLSEATTPGYLVEFRETTNLPEPDGTPIYRG